MFTLKLVRRAGLNGVMNFQVDLDQPRLFASLHNWYSEFLGTFKTHGSHMYSLHLASIKN